MRWFLFMSVVAVFGACAQVGEISGGQKDTTPPRLVASYPAQLSTRFTGTRIELEFDERITLDRVRDRMLISPPLQPFPDVRVSGARSVVIDLVSELEPNTTYSFGIGEAIKDLTEGNSASGLTYVISTGDVVDSLHLAGTVHNAFSNLPEKEVLVMLYDVLDTASIRTYRPAYATRTDNAGLFVLDHLKPGTYDLFALKDQNANYRFDLPNEEVAFLGRSVGLPANDSVQVLHQLRLFMEESPVQTLKEARVVPDGALRFVLAKMGDELTLRDVARTGGSLSWYLEWNDGRDTVHAWPSDTTELRKGRYEINVDGVILDTMRYRTVERMPFFDRLSTRVREVPDSGLVVLLSARPIASIDPEKLTILRDSVELEFTMAMDPADPRSVLLRTDLPRGSSAHLTALPKAVRDIYGGYNDTLRAGIGRAAEQNLGTLRIRLSTGNGSLGPLILHLLDQQGRMIRETIIADGRDAVIWTGLTPGIHGLRLIADDNANGTWDTGYLENAVQPERVWRHAEPVNVRAAWDLVVDWVID